jgi:quercetin dioxygenase-like cupin family protein
MELFAQSGSRTAVETGPGVKRWVLLHTPELMLVAFKFEAGGVGPLHAHPMCRPVTWPRGGST